MKFTVKRQELAHVLENIESVTDEKSPNPVLGYVRLSAYIADKDNPQSSIQLAGSNLRIAIDTSLSAEVSEAGCILTPARAFAKVIKSLSCDLVSVVVNANTLTVAGVGTSRKHKLAIRSAEDFLRIPVPAHDNEGIPLSSAVLKTVLSKVAHAMDSAQSAGRNGVMLEIRDSKLSAVAANSYQIAVYESEVDAADWECMIPAAMHKPLIDLCGASETIRLKRDEKNLYAETSDSIVTTILPGEKFIPWRQAMEMIRPEPVATLARADLVNSIKGVTCVNSTVSVCLSFTKDGNLLLSSTSESADSGEFEATDELACSTVDKPMEINVSAAYLLSNLRSVDSAEVVLRYCYPNQVVVVGPGYHSIIALTSAPKKSVQPDVSDLEPEKPAKKRGKTTK